MIQKELKVRVNNLKKTVPKLAVFLVGNNEASRIYVRNKTKACQRIGIESEVYELPENTTGSKLDKLICKCNEASDVHGILVQLPLPYHFDKIKIINSIAVEKDVDCFHAHNIGMLVQGIPIFTPCTPTGICKLLDYINVSVLGKNIVIINDSIVVGRPLAMLLSNKGATVTICNKHTERLKEISKKADIVVVAVGKRPEFVLNKHYCKEGVVLIDVGINNQNGKLCGDIDIESVSNLASMVTQTPGGIGPLTISVLLENVVLAAERKEWGLSFVG